VTTSAEWLEKARTNADKLRSLIHRYHPTTKRKADPETEPKPKITAAGAEQACVAARKEIAAKDAGKGDPVERFDAALKAGDVKIISSLVSGAWFGLPESHSSRSATGFWEACELLDDPPEDVEYGEDE
jgi:hypothetical protein